MRWSKKDIIERYKEIVENETERDSDRTSALKELLRHDKAYALPKLEELAAMNRVFALKILFDNVGRRDEANKLEPLG